MKTILFQGDSITDCSRSRESAFPWPAQAGCGYANLVSARLMLDHPEKNYTCLNRGISGHRVVDLYARWKNDAVNLQPDLISILIGVNDVWHEKSRRNGVEPDRFEQIYRMMLEWTTKVLPDVKFLLMEPFSLNSEVVDDPFYGDVKILADIVKKLAGEFSNALFLPLQDKFDAALRFAPAEYWLVDGVHPTCAGHQLIADAWLKAAEDLLKD